MWQGQLEFPSLRRLFDTTPVGQALVARDGTILQANPAYHRLLGYPDGALVGGNVFDLTHPDDLATSRRHADRLYQGEVDHYSLEKRYLRRDGTAVWTLLSVAPAARDERGEITQMVGLIQDISEQKQTEVELQRTLTQLARSNAELEQFAYVASHDLLSPLYTVQGFLELLLDTEEHLSADGQEFARRALTAAARMARLIQALFGLARADSADLEVQTVDVGELVAEVLDSLDAPIRDAEAAIEVGALPTVAGDPALLGVVLQNLIGNSLRFRHPDRPLQISIEGSTGPGEAVIRIVDNGEGVARTDWDRIFDAFHRGDSARSGAGIGLATCRRIIDRHGGRIWVDDTPQGGATFTFSLPRQPDQQGTPSPPA
ncbi:MAG: PAS domain S-box protein [Actinomycetota bacterium]|nr:PAS domain S-box protein [Actinomycetota bacterium]